MSGTNVMLFRSTDTGAPTLNGVAGSLIALLDACLKDGYNSKTVTLARVGSTVTATCATAHGFAADGLTKINISGAAQSEYNGDFQITNITTLTFDFTVTGTPTTPATGTITAKVAPIGWGKPYAGTNKGVYRSAETTATRLYLRVDDTTTTYARTVGYETMTDVDTGVNPFPTVAQMSAGVYINKSSTADATGRNWLLIGDGYEFHFFFASYAAYPTGFRQFHFGDPASEMASDPYGCLIYGDTATGAQAPDSSSATWQLVNGLTSAQAGHYMARTYTQIGPSINVGKMGNSSIGATTFGYGPVPYPSPQNNGLYVVPVFVGDTAVLIRASLRALYNPLHTRPLGHGNVVSGLTNLTGRTLYAISTGYSGNTYGETHVDITGPWR
jgi:hypothetical protein